MGLISKFFEENQQLFSNPHGTTEQLEKFNLYGGLTVLARAVEDMENRQRNIESQLNYIQTSIHSIKR